jgi:hypothetical protein
LKKLFLARLDQLDFASYPEFLALAVQAGIENPLDVLLSCQEAVSKYGEDVKMKLLFAPESIPEANKYLLSYFFLHLALSQHDGFYLVAKSWFWGFIKIQFPVNRDMPADDYLDFAEKFYKALK